MNFLLDTALLLGHPLRLLALSWLDFRYRFHSTMATRRLAQYENKIRHLLISYQLLAQPLFPLFDPRPLGYQR